VRKASTLAQNALIKKFGGRPRRQAPPIYVSPCLRSGHTQCSKCQAQRTLNPNGLLLLFRLNLLLAVFLCLRLLFAVLLGLNLLLRGGPLSLRCNVAGRRRIGIAGRRCSGVAGRRWCTPAPAGPCSPRCGPCCRRPAGMPVAPGPVKGDYSPTDGTGGNARSPSPSAGMAGRRMRIRSVTCFGAVGCWKGSGRIGFSRWWTTACKII
jgi:hypothetical protein